MTDRDWRTVKLVEAATDSLINAVLAKLKAQRSGDAFEADDARFAREIAVNAVHKAMREVAITER